MQSVMFAKNSMCCSFSASLNKIFLFWDYILSKPVDKETVVTDKATE